jgi:hypothetical protein
MESGNFKNITMQYLALRWFTLSHFEKDKFKLFHSLERALKNANTKNANLCWYIQTENYLKKEFKKIKMNNAHLQKLQNFNINLQKFLNQHKINNRLFLENIDFMQQCDCIIYHHAHANKNTSDIFTSLP